MGYLNTASGYGSSVSGYNNDASGECSSAFGYQNEVCNTRASAFGNNISHDIADAAAIGSTNTAMLMLCCTGASTAQYEFANLGTGTVEATGGVLSVSSDERLKNIDSSYERGLSDLVGINPITYTWKNQSKNVGKPYAGFSAQNIRENIPEAVFDNTNGYLSLSDRPILAASINAIKELNTRTLNNASSTVGLDNTLAITNATVQSNAQNILNNQQAIADNFAAIGSLESMVASSTLQIDELFLKIDEIQAFNASTTDLINENVGLIADLTSNISEISEKVQAMGASVVDGVVRFVNVFVEKLSVRKLVINNEENPTQTGFVIYDRATGEPICVYFENGEMKQSVGDCDEVVEETEVENESEGESENDGGNDSVVEEATDDTDNPTGTTDTTDTADTIDTTEITDTTAPEDEETSPEPEPETETTSTTGVESELDPIQNETEEETAITEPEPEPETEIEPTPEPEPESNPEPEPESNPEPETTD